MIYKLNKFMYNIYRYVRESETAQETQKESKLKIRDELNNVKKIENENRRSKNGE